jgi:hypothetical protein
MFMVCDLRDGASGKRYTGGRQRLGRMKTSTEVGKEGRRKVTGREVSGV